MRKKDFQGFTPELYFQQAPQTHNFIPFPFWSFHMEKSLAYFVIILVLL